jgi:hypothetical protein
MGKNKTIWVPNMDGFFANTCVGFCPSEKAWKKSIKKMKIDETYPTSAGHCMAVDANGQEGRKQNIILVTIHEDLDGNGDAINVLVHECVHVKQFLMGYIREEEPSPEFEAYVTQFFFQHLSEAYMKSRCPQKKND